MRIANVIWISLVVLLASTRPVLAQTTATLRVGTSTQTIPARGQWVCIYRQPVAVSLGTPPERPGKGGYYPSYTVAGHVTASGAALIDADAAATMPTYRGEVVGGGNYSTVYYQPSNAVMYSSEVGVPPGYLRLGFSYCSTTDSRRLQLAHYNNGSSVDISTFPVSTTYGGAGSGTRIAAGCGPVLGFNCWASTAIVADAIWATGSTYFGGTARFGDGGYTPTGSASPSDPLFLMNHLGSRSVLTTVGGVLTLHVYCDPAVWRVKEPSGAIWQFASVDLPSSSEFLWVTFELQTMAEGSGGGFDPECCAEIITHLDYITAAVTTQGAAINAKLSGWREVWDSQDTFLRTKLSTIVETLSTGGTSTLSTSVVAPEVASLTGPPTFAAWKAMGPGGESAPTVVNLHTGVAADNTTAPVWTFTVPPSLASFGGGLPTSLSSLSVSIDFSVVASAMPYIWAFQYGAVGLVMLQMVWNELRRY